MSTVCKRRLRQEGGGTHVIGVALDKALARVGVVEHLVEQEDALLHPVELLGHLLLVVGLLLELLRAATRVRERDGRPRARGRRDETHCARHDLHELLRRSEVLWRASPNELLQFLRTAIRAGVSEQRSRRWRGSGWRRGTYRGLRFSVLLLQLSRRLQILRARQEKRSATEPSEAGSERDVDAPRSG